MSSLRLPSQAAIMGLLHGLLGKPVTGKPATAPLGLSPGVRAVGIYITDDGSVAAVSIYDIAAAAYLGAALSLIGPAVAAEAHKSGKLSTGLFENLHEVANIAASLMNESGGGHVRLRELVVLPTPLGPDVTAVAASKKNRIDLDVTIPGYGAGKISFILGG